MPYPYPLHASDEEVATPQHIPLILSAILEGAGKKNDQPTMAEKQLSFLSGLPEERQAMREKALAGQLNLKKGDEESQKVQGNLDFQKKIKDINQNPIISDDDRYKQQIAAVMESGDIGNLKYLPDIAKTRPPAAVNTMGQKQEMLKGLLATINDPNSSDQEKADAAVQMQGLYRGTWTPLSTVNPYAFNKETERKGVNAFTTAEQHAVGTGTPGAVEAKFRASTPIMQSQTLIQSIQPLFENLRAAGAELHNSGIPLVNKGINFMKEQAGAPEIVKFNNMRDDLIAEAQRALTQVGAQSDTRFLNAKQNLNSAQSPAQLEAGLQALQAVLDARIGALQAGPRGEVKTPAAAAPTDKRALAREALNDPMATPAEKAAAKRILGVQ